MLWLSRELKNKYKIARKIESKWLGCQIGDG